MPTQFVQVYWPVVCTSDIVEPGLCHTGNKCGNVAIVANEADLPGHYFSTQPTEKNESDIKNINSSVISV